MPAAFRIDEFAQVADGTISARDRTRFSCLGFDLQSAAVVLVNFIRFLSETFAQVTPAGETFARVAPSVEGFET